MALCQRKTLRGQKTIGHCFSKQQAVATIVLSNFFVLAEQPFKGRKSFGGDGRAASPAESQHHCLSL